jgi:hypothetical protein
MQNRGTAVFDVMRVKRSEIPIDKSETPGDRLQPPGVSSLYFIQSSAMQAKTTD